MKLTNTACLAALLLTCPLAVTAVHGADYDVHYNNTPDASGKVASSGYQETLTGSWDNVYIGHAEATEENVKALESSNNVGILGKGFTAKGDTGVWGGNANVKMNASYDDPSSYYGGPSYANTNTLVMKEGAFASYVTGGGSWGYRTVEACQNTVTFETGVTGDFLYVCGGYAKLEDFHEGGDTLSASGNTVTIKEGFDGTIDRIYVGFAGQAGHIGASDIATISATVSDNKLYIFNPAKAEFGEIKIGAMEPVIYGSATGHVYAANNNYGELILNENTELGSVYSAYVPVEYGQFAGSSASIEACGNSLYVTGGESHQLRAVDVFLSCDSFGAVLSTTVTANDNTLVLTDAYVLESIGACIRGYCSDTSFLEATGNTVILKGGTYDGLVAAACAVIYKRGSFDADSTALVASNNRIELRTGSNGAAPVFSDSTYILGGYASYIKGYTSTPGTSSGNSLNFYDVKGMKAGNIDSFQILNYEYQEMRAGDVILTLNGTTDPLYGDEKTTSIAKAKVTVTANLRGSDGGDFKTGDKVVLLKNDNGIDTKGISTSVTAFKQGATLLYDAFIETSEDKTELYLTSRGTKVNPGTKAIAEGTAAGLALVNESSNVTIDLLRDISFREGSITPFVHVQGSSMRHETGSSINMSTVSLMAGLGTGIETGAGTLSAGAFFEYGKGSYTTNNSFDNRSDIDGDGNSWYMGGGILAKMEFLQTGPGHFYLEGSAHMGTLHNEYDSNDLYDRNGNVAKFDMDSPYYSLHGGIGYVWNMAEGHDLDIYGKYIWTRVQGSDDTLTTKDKFEYDDMDSNRVRFGVRYTYKGSERFKPYVGAAFEHEFSGSCDSRVYGHSVAAPSFEGSSGMGELGLMMKPSEDLPLSINLGVQGYVGQKQGVSGNCNIMYEF